MPAEVIDNDNGIAALCDSCSARTVWKKFDNIEHQTPGGEEYFWYLICSGCSRRGLAKLKKQGLDARRRGRKLLSFWPGETYTLPLPESTPKPLVEEFRESECCASVQAHRAAVAMLRSVLEKALKAAGYTQKGNLESKIDLAADHGVLTATLKKRAHDNIRAVGNDVLHEAERKEVSPEEYEASHRYAQQILVALYDHRQTVLETLWDNDLEPEEGPRPSSETTTTAAPNAG